MAHHRSVTSPTTRGVMFTSSRASNPIAPHYPWGTDVEQSTFPTSPSYLQVTDLLLSWCKTTRSKTPTTQPTRPPGIEKKCFHHLMFFSLRYSLAYEMACPLVCTTFAISLQSFERRHQTAETDLRYSTGSLLKQDIEGAATLPRYARTVGYRRNQAIAFRQVENRHCKIRSHFTRAALVSLLLPGSNRSSRRHWNRRCKKP